MKTIIFDFDGVIHDTFEFHKNKIKEFAGIELSEQEFKDIHNGNFYENTNNKIKDINWLGYRKYTYKELSSLKIKKQTKNTLLELHKNYNLFIISSGGTRNILDYLKNNNIISIFKEIFGMEFSKSKIEKFNFIFNKYKIESQDCFFVTDTLGDILEANVVNVKTIAVDFGYHDRNILEKGNPFKVISRIDEILKI